MSHIVTYKSSVLWLLVLSKTVTFINGQYSNNSMYIGKFQKQDYATLQVKLLASTKVIGLLECSTFCRDGCDGFVFCRSDEFQCFQFLYISAADATDLSPFSTCSFYASDQSQAPTTSATSTTTMTTTSSTSPGSTTSTTCINYTGGGCMCPNGATDSACTQYMTDCKDNKYQYGVTDALLHIKPLAWTGSAFLVRCDEGHTVIQMRDDTPSCHSMSFNRSWSEYRDGFGDIANGCFWLGNDKISALSRSRPYLLVLYTLIGSTIRSVTNYYDFIMDISSTNYRLSYRSPWCIITASCDGLSGFSTTTNVSNQPFYTYDQDLNGCAARDGAGWWYNTGCSYGNLNGDWPKWPFDGTVYTLDLSVLRLERTT